MPPFKAHIPDGLSALRSCSSASHILCFLLCCYHVLTQESARAWHQEQRREASGFDGKRYMRCDDIGSLHCPVHPWSVVKGVEQSSESIQPHSPTGSAGAYTRRLFRAPWAAAHAVECTDQLQVWLSAAPGIASCWPVPILQCSLIIQCSCGTWKLLRLSSSRCALTRLLAPRTQNISKASDYRTLILEEDSFERCMQISEAADSLRPCAFPNTCRAVYDIDGQ